MPGKYLHIRGILFLLVSCLLPTVAGSQSYLVHTYNENDGVSSSTVYDVAQDSSGQIWFATRTGISVSDGYEWKSYTVADGLPATSYAKVKIDARGVVWILSQPNRFAVSSFSDSGWQTLPPPETGSTIGNFSSLLITFFKDQPQLWIGTNNSGLFSYADGAWRSFSVLDGLASQTINGLIRVNNQIYIATDKGISILQDGKIDTSLDRRLEFPSSNIIGIAYEPGTNRSDRTDRIWLVGKDWLGYLANDTLFNFPLPAPIMLDGVNHCLALQPDRVGGLFFGNIYDFFHYDARTGAIDHLGIESGLITEGITGLCQDRERNVWATSLRGISKIVSMRFANYRQAHGLLADEVTAIAQVAPGRLVLGHKNGISVFNGTGFQKTIFVKDRYTSEAESRVLDLKIDSKKNIWVAASMLGLARIDPRGQMKWYQKSAGLDGIVTSILIESYDRIWVSDQNGLHVLIQEKFKQVFGAELRDEKSRLFPVIRKIFRGRSGEIWLATSGKGVYRLYEQKWQHYYHPDNAAANNVYAIQPDSERVWLGTLAGLYVLEAGEMKKYSSAQLKINRPVYLIVKDRKQRLWFGTDNGVVRWDGQKARIFTVQKGFAGQETNRAAGWVDDLGQVWIGTDLGVSCYQEAFDFDDQVIAPPEVELLHLEAMGKKLSLHQVNRLPAGENDLVIHYRAISFINEKLVRFRMRLVGFDSDWVTDYHLTSRQARYTNLPSGAYRFEIQAQNALGTWGKIRSSADIVILKPLWQRAGFRWLAVIALLLLSGWMYYLRVARLEKQKKYQQDFSQKLIAEVEQGRKRIASELHDSLGQNLLIIRNGIQYLLASQDLSRQNVADLEEMSLISSEAIEEVRRISYDLHPHQLDRLGLQKAIESCIHRIQKSVPTQVVCQMDAIDHLFVKEKEIHVFRIIQEALSNVAKHARASVVQVLLKTSGTTLDLLISDDGMGFEPEQYFSGNFKGEGFGLAGMAERVKILNGEFRIDAGLGQGVTIKIKIPI